MSIGRAGSDLGFQAEDGELTGYLAVPEGGRGPGVIVIQEWWGLVDHIRDVCDRLAREGFVALAPDLYRGEATANPDEASRLMMDLQIDRAARDLDAAVATLQNQPAVDGAKVGCIGFCMGGQLALLAATRNPRIGAVVDCYGIHPKVSLELDGLEAAVLGIFAEHDDFIPVDRARELESELRGAGKRAHFEIVPGAQHAFLNESRADVYDAAKAAAAWRKIVTFLRAELPG